MSGSIGRYESKLVPKDLGTTFLLHAFLQNVVRDLISKFETNHIIRIKSDNCGYQYCSLHVFEMYFKLSKELGKTIILYYGVNGHGRGLVDAMLGFWC